MIIISSEGINRFKPMIAYSFEVCLSPQLVSSHPSPSKMMIGNTELNLVIPIPFFCSSDSSQLHFVSLTPLLPFRSPKANRMTESVLIFKANDWRNGKKREKELRLPLNCRIRRTEEKKSHHNKKRGREREGEKKPKKMKTRGEKELSLAQFS